MAGDALTRQTERVGFSKLSGDPGKGTSRGATLETSVRIGENIMSAAKNYLACFWGVIAFLALCTAVLYRSAAAGWFFAVLAPPLVVFVWWMVDRAALERRITRLEARSEIADERRVVAQTDLTDVEHKLQAIETRVTDAENDWVQAKDSGAISQHDIRQAEEFSKDTRLH